MSIKVGDLVFHTEHEIFGIVIDHNFTTLNVYYKSGAWASETYPKICSDKYWAVIDKYCIKLDKKYINDARIVSLMSSPDRDSRLFAYELMKNNI